MSLQIMLWPILILHVHTTSYIIIWNPYTLVPPLSHSIWYPTLPLPFVEILWESIWQNVIYESWNTEDKISDKRSSKDYWTQVLQGIKMWDNSPPPPPLKTSIHRNVIYHKSPTLTVWRLGANSWIKVWRVVWRANCPVTTADHLCMIALRTLLHFSEKKHFQWALLFFFLKGGHVKVPQSMSQWGCERGWVCYRSKLNSG